MNKSDLEIVDSSRSVNLQFRSLDFWRGIASLWVVTFHASIIGLADSADSHSLGRFIGQYGYLGVQLFFVISGYCISNAAVTSLKPGRTPFQFGLSRMRRIFPPYLVCLAIICVLKLGAFILAKRGIIPEASTPVIGVNQGFMFYLTNVTMTHMLFGENHLVRGSWSLCYEVSFYLFFFAILLFVRRSRSLIFCFHLLTIFCLVSLLAIPHLVRYPFDLLPQFGLGVVLYDLIHLPRTKISLVVVGAVIVFYALVIIFRHVSPSESQPSSTLAFATAMVFTGLLLITFRWDKEMADNRFVQIISFVGMFSYSLYLFHPVILTLASKIQSNIIFADCRFFILVSASLVGSFGCYLIGEGPFHKIRVRASVEKSPQVVSPLPIKTEFSGIGNVHE